MSGEPFMIILLNNLNVRRACIPFLVTMFQPQRYFAMVLDSNDNQNNTHIVCIKLMFRI